MNWRFWHSILLLPLLALGAQQLASVDEEPVEPELATPMGELQRLVHKMALSIEAGNPELAAFYLYESKHCYGEIQKAVPEYRGQPVALLIERMGIPSFDALQKTLAEKPANRGQMLKDLAVVIQACNTCHTATQHGFIRITPGTEVNPFNQSFAP